MKTQLLLLLILALFFLSSAAHGGRKEGPVGGWTRIKNVSDPHVQEIAIFAVNENNGQKNEKLGLERVVAGENQVVSGVKYKLVLLANNGAGAVTRKYQAVLWERHGKLGKKLISFKRILGDL